MGAKAPRPALTELDPCQLLLLDDQQQHNAPRGLGQGLCLFFCETIAFTTCWPGGSSLVKWLNNVHCWTSPKGCNLSDKMVHFYASEKAGSWALSCRKKFVLVLCILVQLSSRWYLCTLESLYAICPVFQKFPQYCLWNSSRVPRPFKEDDRACFWRLFPPGEWSCDVFGFVIAGSVSSCVLHREVVFTGQHFFSPTLFKGNAEWHFCPVVTHVVFSGLFSQTPKTHHSCSHYHCYVMCFSWRMELWQLCAACCSSLHLRGTPCPTFHMHGKDMSCVMVADR